MAEDEPLEKHFDPNSEVRARAGGQYTLGVGEARQQNLDELKRRREETMKAREEAGAVTLRPGEVEGMRAEEDSVPGKSRAQEKRKREQEERRLLLQIGRAHV